MLLNPHGGSIATIGSTAFSYESPDIHSNQGGIEWLDIHFFETYGAHHIEILGDVWSETITSFLDTFPINWNDTHPTGDAIIAKNVQQNIAQHRSRKNQKTRFGHFLEVGPTLQKMSGKILPNIDVGEIEKPILDIATKM